MTAPDRQWGGCDICGFKASAVSADALVAGLKAHVQYAHPTTVVAIHTTTRVETKDNA